MAKFKRKPKVVTAEQWQPESQMPGVIMARPNPDRDPWMRPYLQHDGKLTQLYPGMWILTDENGEKEAIRDDEFKKNYEKLSE